MSNDMRVVDARSRDIKFAPRCSRTFVIPHSGTVIGKCGCHFMLSIYFPARDLSACPATTTNSKGTGEGERRQRSIPEEASELFRSSWVNQRARLERSITKQQLAERGAR